MAIGSHVESEKLTEQSNSQLLHYYDELKA